MTTTKKSTKKGGARSGAGRPKSPRPMVQITTCIEKSTNDDMRSVIGKRFGKGRLIDAIWSRFVFDYGPIRTRHDFNEALDMINNAVRPDPVVLAMQRAAAKQH